MDTFCRKQEESKSLFELNTSLIYLTYFEGFFSTSMKQIIRKLAALALLHLLLIFEKRIFLNLLLIENSSNMKHKLLLIARGLPEDKIMESEKSQPVVFLKTGYA